MSWVKIDDQLHGHRKIMRAWKYRPALGLHLMSMSYAASHEPQGFVPEEWVQEKLPNTKERERAVKALTEVIAGYTAGLWVPVDGGWNIHDWDEYNGSVKTREEVRAAKSAAGKKGAAARWGDGSDIAACHTPAMPSANGTEISADGRDMAPFPYPLPSEEVGSPDHVGSGDQAARTAPLSIGDDRQTLADHIVGVLQRGVDGLTTDEPCKRPTRAAVLSALGGASKLDAITAATAARSIAQSENRAPNIVGLFSQQLQKAVA